MKKYSKDEYKKFNEICLVYGFAALDYFKKNKRHTGFYYLKDDKVKEYSEIPRYFKGN